MKKYANPVSSCGAIGQSAPLIFHNKIDGNAHDLFQAWRRDNNDGFFINCKSKKDWVVHKTTCRHPGSMEWAAEEVRQSLTKLKKVCSANLRLLKQWAAQNATAKLRSCNDCLPYDARVIGRE